MKRNTLNLTLDAALLLLGLAVLCTGILIAWVLPPRGGGDTVWSWDRHQWGDLHLYLALTLVGLIVVHLALHWSWVCVVGGKVLTRLPVQPTRGLQALTGAAAVLLVTAAVGGFVWLAASHRVEAQEHRGRGMGRHTNSQAETDPQPTAPASSGIDSSIDRPGPSAS